MRELNAMERNQNHIFWVMSAIFVAADSVLAGAYFGQEEHYLARTGLAALGLFVTLVWFLIGNRSRTYDVHWLKRAEALEEKIGIPAEYRVWGGRPTGMSSWRIALIAQTGFVIYWLAGISYAVSKLIT